MKILYLGNNLSQQSKYKTSIAILSELLSQENYEVFVFSNKINKIARLCDMCFQLMKHRKSIDIVLIDTFSTTNFYYAFITAQLARFFELKYIPILRGGNLPNRIEKSSSLSNAIFKHSLTNVAPSNYLKVAFEKKEYKVQLIPNVLDLSDFQLKERSHVQPKLLYVRAFADIYNPKMAIYVLQKVKETYPEACLCMIGPDRDGSLAGVKELVADLGLESSVEFTGVLTKKEWHKKSIDYDIFINTTNFDNTPVSVMEAMALGLPIVSTNAGGLPYLLDDNDDVLMVDKNDINAMTESIFKLLNSDKLVEKLTTNARRKVETFDWIHIRKEWRKILR